MKQRDFEDQWLMAHYRAERQAQREAWDWILMILLYVPVIAWGLIHILMWLSIK